MKHTFKVGDKVQFKSWEEMEKEFGVDSDGDIKTQYYFTKSMQKFCNTYAIIKKIYGDDGAVLLKGFSKQRLCYEGYIFTLDMLKPVKEKEKDLASEDLEDCIEYGLKGCRVITLDDKILTLDEQIKYHEEKLAKLKAQKEKEKWQFTEDEKAILRNLPEEYKYIVRESKEGGEDLTLFPEKPTKGYYNWEGKNWHCIREFNHLFQCIQFTDTEPCEFRKYI